METSRKSQAHGRVGDLRNRVVEGQAKLWHHRGRRGALDRRVGYEMSSWCWRFREEADYERHLVELLVWMLEYADGLAIRSHLDCIVVSQRLDDVCFTNRHKYWARECDFEKHMCVNLRLTQTFVEWQNAKLFAPPPIDRSKIYVLAPDWWMDGEPNCFLLLPLPSVFS